MSAESITKSLRAKGPAAGIIDTANSLLDGKTDVFLPNKNSFILELLCDRANDSGTFKTWKLQPEFWMLFSKTWSSVSNTTARNKIFKRVKLVDAVIAVFSASQDIHVWSSMFKFVAEIKQDYYIDIEDSAAVALLKGFLQAVNSADFSHDLIAQWSSIVNDLYQLPNLNINYTVTKKSYSRFVQDCSPALLEFVTKPGQEPSATEVFRAILTNGMFNNDMSNQLKSNIDQLLKNSLAQLSADSISELFALSVNHLSAKELSICEELYISITSTDKFKGLSPSLLRRLAGVNKSLSTEFFQKIYTSEFDEKVAASKNIDWTLIIYLLDLDIELTMKYSQSIINYSSTKKDLELLYKLGKSILDSHVKGRELNQFFLSVWPAAIEVSTAWKSSQFVSLVAASVDDLSASQLTKLVVELFENFSAKPDTLLPLMTAIFQGLVTCSKAKSEAIKDVVFENKDYLNSKQESFWELRYYLLCLYDSSIVNAELKGKSIYYFYSIFRLIELGTKDINVDSIAKSFLRLIKSDPSHVSFVLNRWIVIIEHFFPSELVTEFIQEVFTCLSHKAIEEYLQSAEMLYEQKQITSALLQHLNSLLEKDYSAIRFIEHVPVQCFDRSLKKNAMETLFKIAQVTKDSNSNVSARRAIIHLLKSPSFKSKLEVDFKSSLKLLDSSIDESKGLSSEIIKTIWTHHLQQINISEHESYIDESFTRLGKDLSKYSPGKEKNMSTLYASFIIISAVDASSLSNDTLRASIEELAKKFYSAVQKSIEHQISQKSMDKNTINWLLNTLLIPNSGVDSPTILVLVKQVGGKVEKLEKSQEIKDTLFRLICKVSTAKDSLYILSLFFALYSGTSGIVQDLEKYLMKLNEEEFAYAFEFVSQSLVLSPNSLQFVPILCSFMRSTKKEYSFTHSMASQILSGFLNSMDELENDSHILILTTVKACLSDMTWLFNQYGIESLITLISKYGALSSTNKFTESQTIEIYIQATQVMSHVLLFHRYKLSSRHHIVINAFVSLLTPLSARGSNPLSANKEAASSYSRLLSNLCEPSVTTMSREQLRHSLNSSTALAKRALRKHVPLLLINYIYLALKFNFKSAINDEIISGIYSIFDVVSTNELQLVNSSLDIPGKSFFRTLHGNYKDFGKWKDQ